MALNLPGTRRRYWEEPGHRRGWTRQKGRSGSFMVDGVRVIPHPNDPPAGIPMFMPHATFGHIVSRHNPSNSDALLVRIYDPQIQRPPAVRATSLLCVMEAWPCDAAGRGPSGHVSAAAFKVDIFGKALCMDCDDWGDR